jgi:hypothetical protein
VNTFVGLRGPDYSLPLEWGAIRQFAKSVYSNHPAWMNDPHAVVPPTFLVSAGYQWGYILERPPPGSELARVGADQAERGVVLDGEQMFIFHGCPPRAGTVLHASTRVLDYFKKQGKAGGQLEFFVMQTEFRDASGRLVCEWRPTSIRTEQLPVQSYAERKSTRPWLRRTEKREQFDAIFPADHEGLSLGSGPGRLTMPPLTLTEMIRYQCASGEDVVRGQCRPSRRPRRAGVWLSRCLFGGNASRRCTRDLCLSLARAAQRARISNPVSRHGVGRR